jgi:hypothetical protein
MKTLRLGCMIMVQGRKLSFSLEYTRCWNCMPPQACAVENSDRGYRDRNIYILSHSQVVTAALDNYQDFNWHRSQASGVLRIMKLPTWTSMHHLSWGCWKGCQEMDKKRPWKILGVWYRTKTSKGWIFCQNWGTKGKGNPAIQPVAITSYPDPQTRKLWLITEQCHMKGHFYKLGLTNLWKVPDKDKQPHMSV